MNEKIIKLQKDIRGKQLQIIELRKQSPMEEIQNYSFKNKEGKKISLESLFEGGDELLVIHNMGQRCKYCTMWADGLRGYSEIISDRMPWVLTSPDEYSVMHEFAKKRDWNFNYLSFDGTSFASDLGYSSEKEGQISFQPGVSALIRKENKIFRVANDYFGPGDLYNPAWHFYDLFPNGVDGWQPKYIY